MKPLPRAMADDIFEIFYDFDEELAKALDDLGSHETDKLITLIERSVRDHLNGNDLVQIVAASSVELKV